MVRRLALLAVVLAALGGAGFWNYQRNLAQEEAQAGPYRAYADAQLAALAEAYEGEIETHQRRYEAAKGAPSPEARGRLLDEQVRDFERANARGRAIRAAGGDLAAREATLREIRKEQARRSEDPTQVLLRRLTTFR
jgi:hypothetical protein